MRHAPSVSFPVGRSLWERRLFAGLWGLVGLHLLGVMVVWAPGQGWMWLSMLPWAGAAGLYVRRWRCPKGAHLVFEEGCWWLGETPGQLQLAWDGSSVLLLQWLCGERVRWLWLEKGMAPGLWQDLRRAVYSPPVVPTTPEA